MFEGKWRFRKFTNPQKLWERVKKKLLILENPQSFSFVEFANLSNDGFDEIKRRCEEHDIEFFLSWTTPHYQAYIFKNKD